MAQGGDIIFTNARVFTADPALPFAEAVITRGNRIVFVGKAEDIPVDKSSAARVVDCQGCTLMPGIIDSHYHLFFGAMELGMIQLWDVLSPDQLNRTIRDYAAAHLDEEALSGVQLRYEAMPPGQRLTRQMLDQIVEDRPLTIMGYDHHTAWANTRALEIAGMLGGAATPPGTEFVMGDDGLASGEMREPAAYSKVLSHFDAWTRTLKGLVGPTAGALRYNPARERRWLAEGLKMTARYGITSVHNMDGDAEQAAFYAALEKDGELTARVNVPFSIFPTTAIQDLDEASEMAHTYQGAMVRSGRVKLFMDGVIESWTGLLLDDYADRSAWKGDALYSAEHFNTLAQEADKRGLQITVHAIGDGAVRRTLDGYERAARLNGRRDSRHRVEHIEMIHPDDLPRFARLGVLASMQPLHCPYTYPETQEVYPGRVGRERWPRAFAWQNIRGAGARVAFGSDWPVVTADPLTGIVAAYTRRPWAAGMLDQRQSMADILTSYTRDGAYFEFQEAVKGQVRPGMLADLALLSADIFATPDADLSKIHAVMTVCDGKIVFER